MENRMVQFDDRGGGRHRGGVLGGRIPGARALAAATGGLLAVFWLGQPAVAAYRPIVPVTPADQTVTLTGHDLTVDQVLAVARYGQPVEVTPEARRHQEDAHGLMLEGALEGQAIPGFNRAGPLGETVLFDGDPAAPETLAMLQRRALSAFESGVAPAGAPQIGDEETVRALMVVRANTLTYAPASAPVMQMLVDFLNDRITPVVAQPGPAQSGAMGPQTALAGIAAAMVGKGDAYYHGIRVTAAQALAQAGLMPLVPVDADYQALTETDAYDIARTAMLIADGRRALEWADLIFAMDLDGMNAGLAPLSLPAQANRPFRWIYWDAGRVLDMLKGGYLFDDPSANAATPSPPRAYPANLTLSPTRQGAAWQGWGALRAAALIALNSSDQSPAFRVGLSPRESPELSTPQMVKYLVRGGKANGGKRGYIVPTLNRDPYPLANEVAFFTASLGMLEQAIGQRTGAPLPNALPPPDDGMIAIGRGRQAIDATFGLLAIDIVNAAKLMDDRAAEDPTRLFGLPPAAARTAFRAAVPAQTAGDAALAAAWQFLQTNQTSTFYPKASPPPGMDDPIPLAQEKLKP
jgi:histidine ammonia-lyase